jgi:hypothetical protein
MVSMSAMDSELVSKLTDSCISWPQGDIHCVGGSPLTQSLCFCLFEAMDSYLHLYMLHGHGYSNTVSNSKSLFKNH